MGSFAYTCCVSGLPIEAGDDVRFFLLTQSPYYTGAENTCCIHDLWFPRTFPLKAKYNDYGSVEDLQEGAARDVWFEGFQIDLIERGVGDNSCHDVSVFKDMDLERWLEAFVEGRVLVRDGVDQVNLKKMSEGEKFEDLVKRPEVSKGVPTLDRIRSLIVEAGLELSEGMGQTGYQVDEYEYQRGVVRVRSERYGKEGASLEYLVPRLSDYACMIRKGTGRYADNAELTIAPKPGRYECTGPLKDHEKKLPVAQAMVREDVWQAICEMPFDNWSGKYRLEHFKRDVLKSVKDYEERESLCDFEHLLRFGISVNNLSHAVVQDVVPFTVGLGKHFALMFTRRKSISEDEWDGFIQTAAEMAHVQACLGFLRYQWRPGSSSGPQGGEWRMHQDFHKKMSKLSKQEAERWEEMYKDDE